MDTCSYFIEDKALFGGYPDNVKFEELRKCGVRYFVDLITTSERDKLTEVYDTDGIKYLNYEIKDRYVPEDIYNYIKFIHNISCIIEELDDGQKLYIHCKGGHGRSGVVVSCILCYLCKYTSEKSLELTNTYHNNRKVMKDKWRIIGSPQTDRQKEFVRRLFKPIFLERINIKNTYFPLNNNSKHGISIDNIFYKNINVLYYSMKDKKFYNKLNTTKHHYQFKQIIENITDNNIEGKESDLIYKAYKCKYEKYEDVRNILKKTLLKPIKYVEDGIDMGSVWEKVRQIMIYD